MALKVPPTVAKLGYALLFNVALPVCLWWWARGAEANLGVSSIRAPTLGWSLVAVGGALVVAGMISLRVHGEGLPMNPWPPVKHVARGLYALVAHPIYLGFTLACAGLSLAVGSAAGLWLVTPVVALAAIALVLGYEAIDLVKRFGPRTRPVLLHLPLAGEERPSIGERVGALLVVMLTFLAAGKALTQLGVSAPNSATVLWAHPAAALLLSAGLAAAATRSALRATVARAWLGLAVVALVLVLGPGGPWGGVWPIRAAVVLPTIAALAAVPSLRAPVAMVASAVAALVVQAHAFEATVIEQVLTIATALLVAGRSMMWRAACAITERLANSWRDWHLGPVRIINHGAIGALGCGVGVLALTTLVGPDHAWVAFVATMAAIVGAALWAQLVEGSPALARPYGFFGGVLGMTLFALAAPWLGTPTWLLLGATATAAPVIQGVARLRCVANGCCHGAPCAAALGIVYRHPMTRPVRLAGLRGVPLHPTQLYSSLSNLGIGAVLARLWAGHAPLALIAGLYLVLMGLCRFVEEAWRGEPQTPVYRGLRLYQWVSLACVIAGAVITCVPGTPAAPAPSASMAGLWATLVFVAVTWLVASVDFPDSNARFARLA
ncbi:MAG: prolipoprotein diacylglyceryl transferase [Deltaproteobacteria bacterium]|nr:prolipoprotein diacylglyceryl transferase [Deltaproteobacteria bacterium]